MVKFKIVLDSYQGIVVEGDGIRVNYRDNFEVWRHPEAKNSAGDGDQEEPEKIVVAEFSKAVVRFWMTVATTVKEVAGERVVTQGEP